MVNGYVLVRGAPINAATTLKQAREVADATGIDVLDEWLTTAEVADGRD